MDDRLGGELTDNSPITADNSPITADNSPITADEAADLKGLDRDVYKCLAANGESRAAFIAAKLVVPRRTLSGSLKRLTDKGLVESLGANRNRTYRLAGRPRDVQ